MQAMATEGYFKDACVKAYPCTAQYDIMSSMFNGGFQILTWGTVMSSLCMHPDVAGPRVVASVGALIGTAASCGFGMLSTDAPVLAFTVLFGLLGMGTNAVFVTSFQFTSLWAGVGKVLL